MGGGGGKKKKPKVEQVTMPSAPTPAPPPEQTAMAPTVGQDEGTLRTKSRDSKKRGTSSLRIELVGGGGTGLNSPGGAGGLNLPKV